MTSIEPALVTGAPEVEPDEEEADPEDAAPLDDASAPDDEPDDEVDEEDDEEDPASSEELQATATPAASAAKITNCLMSADLVPIDGACIHLQANHHCGGWLDRDNPRDPGGLHDATLRSC